jgi:hypothetical protein
VSDEGSALGAAVAAVAGAEVNCRKAKGIAGTFTAADAAAALVQFRDAIKPEKKWVSGYAKGLAEFEKRLRG